MIYDWGNQSNNIQWAAFYSDCEHEVYEITTGHRITLTYNLYAYDQLDGFSLEPSRIDRDSYTLYHRVKEALASPGFLPEGWFSERSCLHLNSPPSSRRHSGISLRTRIRPHK